jgi:general secretion pathway protein F
LPRFRYSAVDPAGRRVEGVLETADAHAAAARLQADGRLVLRVDPDGPLAAARALLTSDIGGSGALPRRRVAEATRELALLLRSGQTLDQALRFTVELTRDRAARAVLARVREKVRNGSALATALADEPGAFPRLYVGLVRAGEQSGTLGETLAQLSALLERQEALTAKVRAALVYPLLLLVASIATVALMLLYVLPQFAPLFADAGATLPGSLRFLLAAGDALAARGLTAGLVVLAAGAVLAVVLRRPGARHALDRLALAVPLAGDLVRKVEAARITRTLGTLLTSGVPLVQGLAITRGVVGNSVHAALLDTALASVKEGRRLAELLERGGLLPARTVHLLQLGEETGQLGPLALRAAEIQEVEVERTLDQLVALIVPIMTIVMGLIVGGIISAVLSAMLSLNQIAG